MHLYSSKGREAGRRNTMLCFFTYKKQTKIYTCTVLDNLDMYCQYGSKIELFVCRGKKTLKKSAPSFFCLSASVTLGGHMVGCGPDPQRGCIPGMAIGRVRAEMPNPLLPQFPHTAVSPAWKQQFRQSYVTGAGCKEKGGLGGKDYGLTGRKKRGRLFKVEHWN